MSIHHRNATPHSRRGFVLVCLVGFLLTQVRAQEVGDIASRYLHDVWTANDGLPVNSATSIVEAQDGYLWIGTWQGLVRFDGVDFKIYDAAEIDGLDSGRITSLVEDDSGGLWMGTTNGGLSRLKDGVFTTYGEEDGFGAYVVELFREPDGSILAWSVGQGIRRIVSSDTSVAFHSAGLHPAVRCVQHDPSSGALWFGTPVGLIRERAGRIDTLTTGDGLLSNNIFSLELDADGSLWIGVDGGVNRLTEKRMTSYPLPSARVEEIEVDEAGRVWFLAAGAGLLTFEAARIVSVEFEDDPIGANPEAMAFDSYGALWVGTTGTGLHRLRQPLFTPYGPEEGIDATQFLGITEDSEGNIWVGTSRDGAFRLSPSEVHRFTTADGLPDERIWSFGSDADGRLWAGSNSGAAYFDGARFRALLPGVTNSVRAIHSHSSGELILAGHYHLRAVSADGNVKQLATGGEIRDNAWVLFESQDGDMWIGTEARGLCRYDGEFSCLSISDRPEHRAVRAIFEPGPGRLWLGSYGGGLCEWYNDVLKCLTEGDGLPDGTVHSIVEDGYGYVWMSSNVGVFRYARSVLDRYFAGDTTGVYPDHFDNWHGMPSSETNGGFQPAVLRASNGRLWYPTTAGITSVDPAAVPEPVSPAPDINRLLVDGRVVPSGEPLPAGADRLVFEFSAASLTHPRDTRFRYRIDGHDHDWVGGGGDKTAIYTNLEPGSYVFKVQGAAGSGPWVESTYPFEIEPFFYQTSWFLLFVVLSTLGLTAAGFNLRVRSLKRRQAELEVLVEERTAQLLELDKAKNRFFANISHEFRTPLQLILGPLENGAEWTDEEQATRFKSLMRSNAQRMLELVNQLLDLAKIESGRLVIEPRAGDLVSFIENLVRRFVPMAERSEIDLRFRSSVSDLNCKFDPDRLDKAVGNVVANTLKFTPRDGNVAVDLTLADAEWIEISVSDTGPGIDPKDADRIFDRFEQGSIEAPRQAEGAGIGLALAHEIMSLHGGTVSVDSIPGQGATFHLRFPVERVPGSENKEDVTELDDAMIINVSPANHEPRERHVILLVDDNPDVRQLLRDFLRDEYEILEAGDGLTALHITRDRRPDVIASDVMMPKMDGFEFVREVRSQPDLRTIPVIILTARASEESAIEGIDLGADNYLRKPVSAAELRARVTRLLDARKAMMERYLRQIRVSPAGVMVDGAEEMFLQSVVSTIETRMGSESFTAEDLADALAMSPRQLRRRLVTTISESPARLIQRMRMERAAQLIEVGAGNVAEVARAVGFSDPSYFATAFRRHFGHAPSEHSSTVAAGPGR